MNFDLCNNIRKYCWIATILRDGYTNDIRY